MSDQWTTVVAKKVRPTKPAGAESAPVKSTYTVPSVYDSETVVFRKNIKSTYKAQKLTTPNSARDQSVSQYQRRVDDETNEGIIQKKTYPEAFRQKLLNWRQSLGLNQKQFAQQLNLTESTIKAIENKTGIYDPTLISKVNVLMNRQNQKSQQTKAVVTK